MVLMHDARPTGSAHSSTAATSASSSRVRHPALTGPGCRPREAARLVVEGLVLVAQAGWYHPFPSRTRS
jgi:hypothetical protein